MAEAKNRRPYEVGYRRPPVASQFREGVSGNPRGRPKKSRNLATILMDAFTKPISVQWNGRERKIPTIEAIMRVLEAKALKGNARATSLFFMALDIAGLTAEVSEDERQSRGMHLPRSYESDEMDLLQGDAHETERQRYLAMAEDRERPRGDSPDVPATITTGDRLAAQRKFAEALDAYRSELAVCKRQLTANSADPTAQYNFRKAVGRIGLVAYTHFLERSFGEVIAVTDEAIEQGGSTFWVAPKEFPITSNTRWLRLLRAHAHMFCDRDDEARLVYQSLDTQPQYGSYTSWECAVQDDFFQLRLTGHFHPLMREIERRFYKAGWIRNVSDPIVPRIDDHLLHAAEIRTADRLVLERRLDEALAGYRGLFVICRNDVGALTLLADRIGRLVRPFLLLGSDATALSCADEAIEHDPYSTSLNLNRAHALMFLNRMNEARKIYFDYHGKMLPHGKMAQDVIKQDFKELRDAGRPHSLMTEVEQRYAAAVWNKKLEEGSEPSVPDETVPPIVKLEARVIAPAVRDDLRSAQMLYLQGAFDDALEVCKRRIAICEAIRAKPVPNLKANEEWHAAVVLITEIALRFVAAGEFDRALATADYALFKAPTSPLANIRRAHALMLLGKAEEARVLYLRYEKERVFPTQTGKQVVLGDFGFLRSHRRFGVLMGEEENLFGSSHTD